MTKRSSVSGSSINNNSHNQKHRKEKLKDRTSPSSTKITSGKTWRTYSLNLSGPTQRQHELYTLQYAIVGIVAVLIYMNSLFGNLVHDDLYAIVRNDDVVSPQSTFPSPFYKDFWGRPLTDERSHKSYRPLTVLTFRWVNHQAYSLHHIYSKKPFVHFEVFCFGHESHAHMGIMPM